MTAASTTIRTATTAWSRFRLTHEQFTATVTGALAGRTISARTREALAAAVQDALVERLADAAGAPTDAEMNTESEAVSGVARTAVDALNAAVEPEL